MTVAIGCAGCRLVGTDATTTPPPIGAPISTPTGAPIPTRAGEPTPTPTDRAAASPTAPSVSAPLPSSSPRPLASDAPLPTATAGVSGTDIDVDALAWRTVIEPFRGDLEQVVEGLFLNRHGEIVAWGRDQEWINSDWGDATTSFWVESDDGTWSKTRIGQLGTSAIARDIADDGDRYVAVGDVGWPTAAWYSLDGAAWTRATVTPERSTEVAAFVAVAAGADGFLSVGQGPRGAMAWFSADGTEWTQIERDFPEGVFNDVVASPSGGFVVVGVDRSERDWDAFAWTVSSDGRDWRAADPSNAIAGPDDDDLYRVWAYERGYLALGEHGDERLTCDGSSALIASTGPMVAHGPCWSHEQYVYTSNDGHHWRRLAIDEDGPAPWEFTAVEPWGDGLIAVGAGRDFVVRVWLSDDGIQWTHLGDPVHINGQPAPLDHQRDTVNDLLVASDRLVIGGSLESSDGYVTIGTTSP